MAINLAAAAVTATNHPNKRTIGAHLGDIYNVLGFGAVGNDVHDDTANIQAAVDAAIAAGGGTVYFPISPTGLKYVITSAITFSNDSSVGIRFLGEGTGTTIFGTVNGYLLDRSLGTPNNTAALRIIERLNFINGHATGGCVRFGSTIGGVVRGCTLSGHIGLTTEDSAGVSSENIMIQDCVFTGRGDYTGANAVIIGGGGSITGSYASAHNTAYRCYGSGLFIGSGRIERCNTAIMLGVDSAGSDAGMKGVTISAHTLEGNWTAIDFVGTTSGFNLQGIYVLGHDSTNAGPEDDPAVFSANQPAAQACQYGVRMRADKAVNGVCNGIIGSNHHEVSVFSLANSTSRANILITGCDITQSGGGGVGWDLPTKAHTARLINNNVASTFTFANLPASPLEGEEYSITDSNTATWGATAAAGGSNHVVVRYNGTNWTVVGA